MLIKPKTFLPVLLAFFIGGCAVGNLLVRPEPDSLKNGHIKYSQIIERFGIPWGERTVVKHEKSLKTIYYDYFPAPAGAAGARSLGFYFFNDVLVGHDYMSSVREDSTKFDDSKIGQIVKGKSTRAEVGALLGRPGGFYIYPMINTQFGEAAVYRYSEVSPGLAKQSIFWKSVVVTFDTGGIVTDVEYSSGSR